MAANDKKLNEIIHRTDEMSFHGFNPLHHPILLSRPLKHTLSSWSQHIPFAMFSIDLLRPRTFVELGTFAGVSYCAFCQAVKQLGLDTRCYAIDNWKGDKHNGFYEQDILDELREHHDPLYGDFSQLIRSGFDEALPHFDDDSIDLLHIDGYHTYEAVRNDFTKWLPKMSDQGVMLFHDIKVYEHDFGVWKVWKELKAIYPHFEFEHGYGLGLLAVGKSQPASLKKLVNAPESEQRQIREFFSRLGSEMESSLKREEELQTISMRLKEELGITAIRLEQSNQQLKEKEAEIQKIASSPSSRFMRLSRRIKYKYMFALYRKLGLMRTKDVEETLLLGLDVPLPEELKVGKGNALFISGWCFHTTRKIKKLEIIIDSRIHPVKALRLARRDILDQHFPALDPNGNSYQSGFWIVLTLPRLNETVKAEFQLKAILNDGSRSIETMGTVILKAEA